MLKLTKKISSITCLYVIMHLGIWGRENVNEGDWE